MSVSQRSLGAFQDAFASALFDDPAHVASEVAGLASQPAFAVYRNTVVKGCIDALIANFPAVTRLVGKEWMHAAATLYVREHRPRDPTLLRYGDQFADFIARFPPAAEITYLPDVARIDRLWTEVHSAPDDDLLNPEMLAGLSQLTGLGVKLRPHRAARWAWFTDTPAYSIWSRNRGSGAFDGELEWEGEGVLLTRPHQDVRWMMLDRAGCEFLDACAEGQSLPDAAAAALAVQGDINFQAFFAMLLTAGVFGAGVG